MKRKSNRRLNGEGTIAFERDRNKYRAFLTDITGKRISKRFDTRQDALQWLTETKADIYRDEYIPNNNITLGEWVLTYLETYKKNTVRATTYQTTLALMKHLAPISDYALQDTTNLMFQKFFNELDISISTKRLLYSKLKPCMCKAVSLGVIKTNPIDNIDFAKQKATQVDVFTQEEVNAILKTIKQHSIYRRYYPYFLLAFATGMRIGELNALKISNVHENYVYVDSSMKKIGGRFFDGETKTISSVRTITVPAYVSKIILENHDGKTEYAFYTWQKNPCKDYIIRERWEKILKICNLPQKKFHSIRHTHATLLIANGVPITEIAKRLGHKNCQMIIRTYAHYLRGADTKIADTVGDILALHPNCSQNQENCGVYPQ